MSTIIPKNTHNVERKTAGKMRKCLTKLSRIIKCGAVLRCGLMVSSPGPCVSSGGRLPEARFTVFLWDSKGAKACKSCRSRQELSNEYLLARFVVDTAENVPLKVCQKLAKS